MTATLLRAQRHQLENQCKMTVYDDRPEDLAKIADAPRYNVKKVSRNDVDAIVREALEAKKRVLWVVNKVANCPANCGRIWHGQARRPDVHRRWRTSLLLSLPIHPGRPQVCAITKLLTPLSRPRTRLRERLSQ